MKPSPSWCKTLLIGVFCALPYGAQTPPPKPPSFHREVLPILRTACLGCHSVQTPTGGIALGSYADLKKGGKNGAAIVPGKASESRLFKMLTGALKPQMPPGSPLKPTDIETIRRWIDTGAKSDEPAPLSPRHVAERSEGGSMVKRTTALGKRLAIAAPVNSLAYSPDGQTLAIGTYQKVLLCNPTTRETYTTWSGHADTVRTLAFSPDGKWLAAGGGISASFGEVRLWSVAEKRQRRLLTEHTDTVNALAFNVDSTLLVTASSDKNLGVWDVATGKRQQTLRDHADAVLGVAFHPGGKLLVSVGADKNLKAWDTTTTPWRRLSSTPGGDESLTTLTFATNGQAFTGSTDRAVKQWNVGAEGANVVRTLRGHEHAIWAITAAKDGQTIATASGDKTARLWRVSDGGNVATLLDAPDWLYSVALRPDGKQLAAGCWNGNVYLWDIATRKWEGVIETK